MRTENSVAPVDSLRATGVNCAAVWKYKVVFVQFTFHFKNTTSCSLFSTEQLCVGAPKSD